MKHFLGLSALSIFLVTSAFATEVTEGHCVKSVFELRDAKKVDFMELPVQSPAAKLGAIALFRGMELYSSNELYNDEWEVEVDDFYVSFDADGTPIGTVFTLHMNADEGRVTYYFTGNGRSKTAKLKMYYHSANPPMAYWICE